MFKIDSQIIIFSRFVTYRFPHTHNELLYTIILYISEPIYNKIHDVCFGSFANSNANEAVHFIFVNANDFLQERLKVSKRQS